MSTNSICQGEQVPILWSFLSSAGLKICFAHTSFKWKNLATNNAGVFVVVIGLDCNKDGRCLLYQADDEAHLTAREAKNINAYLVPAPDVIVSPIGKTPPDRARMVWGNKPTDDGNFFWDSRQREELLEAYPELEVYIRPFVGAIEYIRGLERHCLWVSDTKVAGAIKIPEIQRRFDNIRKFREKSKAAETRPAAHYPHRFRQIQGEAASHSLIVPKVSSETRVYLPVGLLAQDSIVSDNAFALYDAPLWNIALIASRLHLVWIATVCGKLKTDYRYSNTLGWNTFPVPRLTENQKAELTRCAEDILLAREAHFPATIAELYDPENMPDNLRAAHDKNDETLERIYIGRRFKNDTERLEKLFDMYTSMTRDEKTKKAKAAS